MPIKAGIDLGSRFVKIAVKEKETIKYSMMDTVEFYRNCTKRDGSNFLIDLDHLGIDKSADLIATGYGRNMMKFSNAIIISEIKAHFRGALEKTQLKDFVLIDIGGQDSKVIFAKEGYINDFVMNDKCAASTGRFMENACNILKISLEELSEMTTNPAIISSTCAIFSESEIIGRIAEGLPVEEIGAGINESTAKRLMPLIKKFNSENILASGGVAANKGLLHFIESTIGKPIKVLHNSQYNGAFGCLFY